MIKDEMTYLNRAIQSITQQSKALQSLAQSLPQDLTSFIQYVLALKGRVILLGVGKSGFIAQKIAASLASTGTPAFYIHPCEASHGDLGMITADDVVLMLSNSGETRELFDTVNYCKKLNIKIASMTMQSASTLARNSDFMLTLPQCAETSTIVAPTTSALMMLSLGDALITILHEAKRFTNDRFKLFHPGGKIGNNLLKVSDLMHTREKLPVVFAQTKFTDVIIAMTIGCLGCAIVVDNDDKILGMITDGDLRRHIEDDWQQKKASDVMNPTPRVISPDSFIAEAIVNMNKNEITNLLVVAKDRLIGLVHIHDILKLEII